MSTTGTLAEKPGVVTTLGLLTLINGILNIVFGLVVTAMIVLGTFFVGIICVPVTALPAVLGIFEILYAIRLLANPPRPLRPSKAIAILEICAILAGNVISMVVGIVGLVFYSEPIVKAYFERINTHAA